MDPGVVAHPSLSYWALLHLLHMFGDGPNVRSGAFTKGRHSTTEQQLFCKLLAMIARGGFEFKVSLLWHKGDPIWPRPYPRGDCDGLSVDWGSNVDMELWANLGGYDTNQLRHAFIRAYPAATFCDLWGWLRSSTAPSHLYQQLLWQAGLRLQSLFAELFRGVAHAGLKSSLVDVAALLSQPQSLNRALARYMVPVKDIMRPLRNISLCTDKH